MRRHDPVWWDARSEAFILTRNEDIRQVLRDPAFSVARNRRVPDGDLSPAARRLLRECDEFLDRWLVFSDRPRHTALRAAARGALTRENVDKLGDDIGQAAEHLLPKGPVASWDVVSEFAMPLAAMVGGSVLGVPTDSRLGCWGGDLFRLFRAARPDAETIERASAAIRGCRMFFGELLASEKGDGFVAGVARTGLAEDDLIGLCVMFMAGTRELTGHAIGNSAFAIMSHPEVPAGSSRELPLAIEEALRYCGPTFRAYREATEDRVIGGFPIERGKRVLAILHAANHDPQAFPDPHEFRLREKNPHLALGVGLHSCVAAPLVRLATGVALRELFRRSPRIHPDALAPAWIPNLVTRGLRRLPVEIGAR